ncbi:MAG: DedA family protein [Culicoidibacterales bacterium]
METLIISILNQFGYLGIALLIAIENVFPPIPSEVILTFGGFLTTTTDLTLVGVILAATLGAIIGAFFLYWIGSLLTTERLTTFLQNRWVRRLSFQTDDIHKTIAWFDQYENKAVFFGRFIPVIRSLISIPAGIARMNRALFVLYTTLGSLIWNTVLAGLGAGLGESWQIIATSISISSRIILIILILIFAVGLFILWKKRQIKKV